MKVTEPYGEDRIILYAREVNLGHVSMVPAAKGLNRYNGTRESLGGLTCSTEDVSGGPISDSGAEFYEVMWLFTTTK